MALWTHVVPRLHPRRGKQGRVQRRPLAVDNLKTGRGANPRPIFSALCSHCRLTSVVVTSTAPRFTAALHAASGGGPSEEDAQPASPDGSSLDEPEYRVDDNGGGSGDGQIRGDGVGGRGRGGGRGGGRGRGGRGASEQVPSDPCLPVSSIRRRADMLWEGGQHPSGHAPHPFVRAAGQVLHQSSVVGARV